jgi:hypothetical protein
MTKKRKPEELTEEELEETNAEPLPERAALSVIRPGLEPLPDDTFPVEPDPPHGVVPLEERLPPA